MGKRERIVTESEMNKEALRQIQSHFSVNIRGDKQRYYDEWEAFLRLSTDDMIAHVRRTGFAPGGEFWRFSGEATDENIWKYICGNHANVWCIMAEARYYVMNFFRQAKEYFPQLSVELQELDNQFWVSSTVIGKYRDEINDPVDPEVFKKSDVRVRMADCIVNLRQSDAEGLALVKELLEKMEK